MTSPTNILRVFADPKKVKLLGQLCDQSLPLHILARAMVDMARATGICRRMR